MPEKNANYCYNYLSRKVCHNEAETTLHLGDIAFPKQLDELYPMHRATASAEGVGIDFTNEYLIRSMLENSETGFWSERSVYQRKFGLKSRLAYPTSTGMCYFSDIWFTPSPEVVGVCIG